ncbi:MAG: elongation factor P [Bacillota bacterium]|uniref:Elongation factor P n=2 Tax=Carboxydocella TaxID=178898 RepID=A0A1T4S909_9FIRM|nr:MULTISPECIES: elongation factor P [Carboxydocella]AVX20130.1 translation elongation factor P (EF-P) [Carboxydocella thermautotrophica]AVX30549.1 translation elongation factor P (EF-P) [Carboxydocella thermautotrophica]SKA24780.1 translation elongation factor P (EF-P) [Carboxydocella sporoproducens DSM 16521]GAW28454.1 elongation factor P [Carboxydocella sp. ULO1]GAW31769.1 elongation factor P [Carboxydocella sp. JDF658]
MISSNDFRNGMTIEVEGDVYQIVEFQHVKPGKGAAFVRTKLKNVRTGAVIERTFNAGEKVPKAHVERKEMQYLYNDGENYNFMDMETYDQVMLSKEQLGDAIKWLKDNMNIHVLMFQGQTIGVEVPNFVELKVVDTPPGIKGDTASGGSKPATLETGAVVQVPFFVETGDVLQIDTRTGTYIKRV